MIHTRYLIVLATGLLACGTKKDAPADKTETAPAKAATGPAVDPSVFAELDTSAWPATKLPKAGVSVRIPKGVTITESGKLNMAPVGPYIGLTLASGYEDVQIDTDDPQLADSKETAKEAAAAGKEKILLDAPDALVRQRDKGCAVSVCKAVGKTTLCVSAGGKTILGAGGKETVVSLTPGDCASLLAIVRSLEPL
ncbi:MAG TPA: hypothetical protein VGM39_13700 [Kofleriaceae bacterium]|jgi:hypothetical protein